MRHVGARWRRRQGADCRARTRLIRDDLGQRFRLGVDRRRVGWRCLTLTALEIVLGIDNVVFISILSSKLPPASARTARKVGMFLAMSSASRCCSRSPG
jgi:hypothetical protein